MFLTYATAQGRVLLDREPYLPQVWAYDGQRQREAGVPEEVAFRTEPQVAREMLGPAVEPGQSPSAGSLGMECTAVAATCGCGWSGREFPTCWPSRATRSCGPDGSGATAGKGGPNWRPGWKNPTGSGSAPETGPRVPGSTIGPGW